MNDNAMIEGKAYVVGDDIDTDQIIPAQYLAYNPAIPEERKYFGMYAMCGVPEGQMGLPDGNIPFVEKDQFTSAFKIVIGGWNFGCGSSREHAPLAIAEAGAVAVIAQFYARIFFRNCVNGGYLLPYETDERLIDEIATGHSLAINRQTGHLTNHTTGRIYTMKTLGDVEPIIQSGGIFNYAKKEGMI